VNLSGSNTRTFERRGGRFLWRLIFEKWVTFTEVSFRKIESNLTSEICMVTRYDDIHQWYQYERFWNLVSNPSVVNRVCLNLSLFKLSAAKQLFPKDIRANGILLTTIQRYCSSCSESKKSVLLVCKLRITALNLRRLVLRNPKIHQVNCRCFHYANSLNTSTGSINRIKPCEVWIFGILKFTTPTVFWTCFLYKHINV